MRVLLTGGAGFIGLHIAERLHKEGYEISIFSRFHRDTLQYIDTSQFEVVKGDVLKPDDLERACRDVDIIIHLAAITGIEAVAEDPILTMKTNFVGAMNIFDMATELKVRKVLTFSTSEVYGSMTYQTPEDAETVMLPVGDERLSYAASKIAADHLARCYYLKQGLPVAILRPFNIYGERQVGHGAISLLINWALKDKPLIIYGDGLQKRAWCHVDDLTDAVSMIINNRAADGEVLNIGNPSQTITVLALAKKIIEMTGSRSTLEFRPIRAVDVNLRVPNIEKAQEMLGFQPKITLEEGLRRAIEFYKKHDVKTV